MIPNERRYTVELTGFQEAKNDQVSLNQAEISFFLKDQIYSVIQNEKRIPVMIAQLISMGLDEKLLAVLMEIISAYNIEERT